MISVRASRSTYLCLTDDSYTAYYAGLSLRRQSATPPTVLCSCFPFSLIIPQTTDCRTSFSLLFVPPSDSGGMEFVMIDKIFVDSNVWIYLFADESNPKSKTAENFIAEAATSNIIVISYQVMNEVSNVLKKKKFSEPEIRFVIENMAKICVIQVRQN